MREPIFISKDGSTLYVRLPEAISEPIEGGCDCDYCKAHPEQTPRKDTLCLARVPVNGHEYTWVVHYPELLQKGIPYSPEGVEE